MFSMMKFSIGGLLKTAFAGLVLVSVASVTTPPPFIQMIYKGRKTRPSGEQRKRREEKLVELEMKLMGEDPEIAKLKDNKEELRRKALKEKRKPPVIKTKEVLLKEAISSPLFEDFRGTSTPFGFTLLQSLVKTPGRINGDIIDLIAGDVHCYKTFSQVYQPVYITLPLRQERHPFCFDHTKLEMPYGHDPGIVRSIHFAVSRSIKEHRFLPASQTHEKLDLERNLVRSFSFLPEGFKGCYFSLQQRMFGGLAGLFEARTYGDTTRLHRFLSGLLWTKSLYAAKHVPTRKRDSASLCNVTPEGLANAPFTDLNSGAGIHKDWPTGRGIYVSENRKLCLAVNRDCHLKIYLTCETNDTLAAFKEFCALYRPINRGMQRENLHFAYDDKFGFVNWNANKSGSNLEVSAKVDLPLLQHHEMFNAILRQGGLRGKFLNDEDDCVEIIRQGTYGESEPEIMYSFNSQLRWLTLLEWKTCAEELSDLDLPSKDYVERAASYLDDAIVT